MPTHSLRGNERHDAVHARCSQGGHHGVNGKQATAAHFCDMSQDVFDGGDLARETGRIAGDGGFQAAGITVKRKGQHIDPGVQEHGRLLIV